MLLTSMGTSEFSPFILFLAILRQESLSTLVYVYMDITFFLLISNRPNWTYMSHTFLIKIEKKSPMFVGRLKKIGIYMYTHMSVEYYSQNIM